MAKLTLKDVGTGFNLKEDINSNNDAISDAIDDSLSLSGKTPNSLNANIDMNGKRILNLPDAINSSEPLTLGQSGDLVGLDQPLTSALVDQYLDKDDLAAKLEDMATTDSYYTGYYPKTAAETAAVVTITNYEYQPGDVRRYGAVGDGSTPDDAAFAAAIAQNEEDDGAPILSHQADYYMDTGVHWCSGGQGNKIWNANYTRLVTDSSVHDITPITIGPFNANIESQGLQVTGRLSVDNLSNTFANSTKPGILMGMIYTSEFHLEAQFFDVGIEMRPNHGGGFVYNSVHLGRIWRNRIGLWLRPWVSDVDSTQNGWCNENTFYGGRFAVTSSDVGDTYYIYMPRTGKRYGAPNNNTFFRPSLEGDGATAGYYDASLSNTLLFPRLEMSNTVEARVWLTDECERAFVFGGMYGQYSDAWGQPQTIRNQSSNSVIIGPDYIGLVPQRSGASQCLEIMRPDANTSSTNKVPVVDIKDLYSGSGTSQTYRSIVSSTGGVGDATSSHHFLAQTAGQIVSNIIDKPTTTWTTGLPWDTGDRVVYSGRYFKCTQVANPPGTVSVTPPATPAWDENTTYSPADQVINDGNLYICTTGGTSSATGPGPLGEGSGISDGTVVWDFQAPGDAYLWKEIAGGYYECIQAHTSTADDEPGVGADWGEYWDYLHVKSKNDIYSTLNTNEWALTQPYTTRTTNFKIKGNGEVWTNQTSATGAAGAVVAKMPIYDENGGLVGYVDIKDLV